LQIWKGDRKGCRIYPKPVETDFKVYSNHILVEMTVSVIFTKVSKSFASFWVMMMHHIPEGFFPGL
jgi:hypothetical protein